MTMLYARYPKTIKKINETDPEDAFRALTSMLDNDLQSVSTMYSVENL